MSGLFLCVTQTCDIGSNALLCRRADLHQAQTGTNSEPSFPISAEKSPSCPCDLTCCSLPASLRVPFVSAFSSPCFGHAGTCETGGEGLAMCAGGAVSEGGEGVGYFPSTLRGLPTRPGRPGESIPGRRNRRSCGISFLSLRRWQQEGAVVKPRLFCCHCHHRFWHNC